MSNLVTCPACKSEFAVTEALKSQLSGQVRAELEMEFAAKNEKLRSQGAASASSRGGREGERAVTG